MNKQKPVIKKTVVIGIVENERGEILLTQRLDPKIQDAHLKWDFPGGTREVGETLRQTLWREIREETGLEVKIEKPLGRPLYKLWDHQDYFQKTRVYCYSCHTPAGALRLGDHKINDLRWVSPKALPNYAVLATSQNFLNIFLQKNGKIH